MCDRAGLLPRRFTIPLLWRSGQRCWGTRDSGWRSTTTFKACWLAEHHNIQGVACSATSVLIGFIANGTSTIRVGSGGIMLPNHSPLVIAEQFGTLESLFPGRIDLGLGRAPGGDSAAMRALRGSFHGGDDFPEQVEELRRYLGERFASQRVHAYPGEGTNVPIYLLGSSDFSARLAGALGLPFAFAAHFQPQPLLAALQIYRSTFRPSEALEKPYAMVGVPILVADSDERAQFLATTPVQMFLNLIRGVPGPMPGDGGGEIWRGNYRRAGARGSATGCVSGTDASGRTDCGCEPL